MAHTHVDWATHIDVQWDAVTRSNSVARIINAQIPAAAGPVACTLRAATPRVFAQTFRFNLNAVKVNAALRDQRGRGLVITSNHEQASAPPLAALAWHLPQALIEPLVITTASPRLDPEDRLAEARVDLGFVMLVDAVVHIAQEHRAWALGRLADDKRARARAEKALGPVLIDVEGQDELQTYLMRLFGSAAQTAEKAGNSVTRLRILR
jgi:hypothetical protein